MTTNPDQGPVTSLSPIVDYNQLERVASRDLLPLASRVYDLTTPDGMADAKADLKTITGWQSRLETVRKAIKDEPYRLCQLIDSEAKRIGEPVDKLVKLPLKASIAAEENRLAEIDARRVKAITDKINLLRRRPAWGWTAGQIAGLLEDAQAVEVDATFAEFEDEAAVAKAEALRDLRQMLEAARASEATAKAAAEAVNAAVEMAGPQETPAGHERMVDSAPAAGNNPQTPMAMLLEIRNLADSLAFGAVGDDRERLDQISGLLLRLMSRADIRQLV